MKLDYKKMVEEIEDLVSTDFFLDMELKTIPKSKPYTQREAKIMAETISKVYSISHCTTCTSCQIKYLKK